MGVSLQTLTSFLLAFWLLYVLSMAVGVSEDLSVGETIYLNPGIVEAAQRMGHFSFMAGALGTPVILVATYLYYLRDHGMVWQAYVASIPLLVMPMAYLLIKMLKASWEQTHSKTPRRKPRRRRKSPRRTRIA